jgi:hypothetical protein
MSDIKAWSVTADNNTAAAPDGWPEGMAYSTVNNAAREMQAAVARWHRDSSGYITATGSNNSYTVAPEVTYSAYASGIMFCFIAGHANTGPAQLRIDALAYKDLKDAQGNDLAPGAISLRQVVPVQYDAANGYFRAIAISNGGTVGLSVKQFGARGDGVADDGVAINLAADYMRAVIAAGSGVELNFPSGTYRTTISLNFTSLRSSGGRDRWAIRGAAATVYGECAGKAVMDFLFSQQGLIAGISVVGDETDRPRVGIQIGRATINSGNGRMRTASNITLEYCRSNGFFTWAGFYSYGSELNTHIACTWANQYNTTVPVEGVIAASSEVFDASFAAIFDGNNSWDVDSDYITVDSTSPYTVGSFQSIYWQQCSFVKVNGGPGIYLDAGITNLAATNSYIACKDGDAVVAFITRYRVTDSNPAPAFRGGRNWDLELHMESDSPTDETLVFRNGIRFIPVDDNGASPFTLLMSNMRLVDGNFHGDEAVFRLSGLAPSGSVIRLAQCEIQIMKFRGNALPDEDGEVAESAGPPSLGVFAPANAFRASGSIYLSTSTTTTTPGLQRHVGDFATSNIASSNAIFPVGSYRIVSDGYPTQLYKGQHEFYGERDTTYEGAVPLQAAQGVIIANGRARNEDSTWKLPNRTSDPTVSNGSVYYNTATNKFRKCENGAWADM